MVSPAPFRRGISFLIAVVTTCLAVGPITAIGNDGVEVISLATTTGVKSFMPGRWGTVRVVVLNRTDHATTARVTVHVESASDLRFGRDVWLPAGTTRETWIPIHLPADMRRDKRFEIVGRVVSGASEGGGLGSRLAGMSPPGATVLIDDGIFGDAVVDARGRDPAYESVLAMFASQGLSRRLVSPAERILPATIEGWDAVRHVVVAGKRVSFEAGAAAALGGWVAEGGRMWLQLNRAGEETARALFGADLRVGVVDRVPLTSFELGQSGRPLAEKVSIERDEAVDFIRARVDGGRTLYEIDGWPAAVEFPYGRGSVLVTLLDAHGWMRERNPSDPDASDAYHYTDYLATEPLEDFARSMYQIAEAPKPDADIFAAYATDKIGYQVPGRATVLGTLGLFCGGILVAGLVLVARGRLEHLAWVAATGAGIATVVLVSVGRASRAVAPPSLAELRLIEVIPGSGDRFETGVTAIYYPELVEADLHGRGVRVDPQMPELAGQIREWIWSDRGRWRWEGTRLPPGLTLMAGEAFRPLAAPISGWATFGPEGLEGSVSLAGLSRAVSFPTETSPGRKEETSPGPADDTTNFTIDDAVILFPHSRPLAGNLDEQGGFRAAESDRLASGQFTNKALLGDEERRRGRVMRGWLADPPDSPGESSGSPGNDVPRMAVWVDGGDVSLDSGRVRRRAMSALVTFPLRWTRPAESTRVEIPSVAIRSQAVESDVGHSTVFNNRTESWNYPNSGSQVTRLRFQIPAAVLPMRIDAASLTLDCHLPSRPLDVFVVGDAGRERVGEYLSPSGDVTVRVDDPERLAPDSGGGLTFEIVVGELRSEVEEVTLATGGWSIRDSRLEVSGLTLPSATEVN